MNNFINTILPSDVWSVVLNNMFEDMFFMDTVFSKYKYMIHTYTANYATNTQLLEFTDNEYPNILRKISRSSNLGMIKYLYHYKLLTKNDVIIYDFFQSACNNESLKTMNYLAQTFKITKHDIFLDIIYVFRDACIYNRHKIVMYLITTFDITCNDLIIDINDILRCVSSNGYLEMFMCLTQAFKLTCVNVVHSDSIAYASKNGHLDICKYLINTFPVTPEEIASDYFDGILFAFRMACKYGHLEIVRYIAETFELTGRDVASDGNFAFHWASINGHGAVLEYLNNNFNKYYTIGSFWL